MRFLNTLLIGYFVLFANITFAQKGTDTSLDSEIKRIVEAEKEFCSIPVEFENNYSNDVEKVANFNDVVNKVSIQNSQKVIIQAGVLHVTNTNSQALYSPDKSEKNISDSLQKLLNVKLDQILKKVDNLTDKIPLWNNKLEDFAIALKKLSEDDPTKKQGIEVLRQYKNNIDAASCLNNDYINEAIITQDKKGNKEVVFDLEKIKNDPNYLYVGNSVNGFRVIKKRNKYGYLKDGETNLNKVTFKYDYAENYHESGFTVASEDSYIYVLDSINTEKLKFYNIDDIKISIINKNRFLIQTVKNDVITDNSGKTIIKSKQAIKPTDFSKQFFYVIDSISIKQLEKSKFGMPIIKNNEHLNELEKLSYLKTDKKVLTHMYICNLNGENISEKFENDKRILTAFNAIKHNLSKISRSNDNDMEMILLQQVLVLPNTNYHFYLFKKVKSHTSYYVIKDALTDEIIHEVYLDKKEDFKSYSYFFYPIKPLNKTNTSFKLNDLIIGCRYMNHFKYNLKKNKIPVSVTEVFLKTETSMEYLNDSKEYIYNISQQRYIGGKNKKGFIEIYGSIDENKTIFIGRKNENGEELIGSIDANGLYVIPPITKGLNYNLDGSFHGIKTFKDDNEYELDKTGKCTKGNCDNYNQQVREYFESQKK